MKVSARIAAFEFAGDTVRLAVVKTGGKTPVILEALESRAQYAGPEERFDALVQTVRDVVGKVKTRKPVYVLSASSAYSVVRVLKVPFRGAKRVAAAVRFELEPYLAFSIEELVVDFSPIREKDGGTEVLAVGMRHAVLAEQVAVLREAGVDPEGINIDVAGLTSLWQAALGPGGGLRAALHVRQDGAILSVIDGKSLVYFRHLAVSAAQVHASPNAAAREVQNLIRAFVATREGEQEIASLTVTGVDLFEEEKRLFEEHLQIPADYVDLLSGVKGAQIAREAGPSPESADEQSNAWEPVVGIAACAAGDGLWYEFRKGPLRRSQAWRGAITHAVFSAGLAALLLIGYVGFCFADYRNRMNEIELVGEDIRAIFKECYPGAPAVKDPPANDFGGMQSFQAMATLHESFSGPAEELQVSLFSRPTLLDILLELAQKMPAKYVTLTELRLQGGKTPELVIAGDVNDPNGFNEVLQALKQSPLFATVSEPQRRAEAGGKSTFEIRARF